MRRADMRLRMFDKTLALGVFALILVRCMQLAVHGSHGGGPGGWEPFAQYSDMTGIGYGVFVLTPLILLNAACALKVLEIETYCMRMGSRDRAVASVFGLMLVRSALPAAVFTSSAMVCLCAAEGLDVRMLSLAAFACVHTVLVACYGCAVSLLMACAYLMFKRVQLAFALACLCALIDFIVRMVPGLAGSAPSTGWGLTEIAYPVVPTSAAMQLMVFLAALCALLAVFILLVRRTDLVRFSEGDRGA